LRKNEIEKIVKDKKAIYDLKVDQRVNKIGNGSNLVKFKIDKLPRYLIDNIDLYKNWLD